MMVLEIKETYPEITDRFLDDIIKKIKSDQSEKIKQHYAEEIKKAETSGDKVKLKTLVKEFQNEISK